MRRKKIGVMGGTFDPIHLGHLLIAQSVLDELKLDEVLFIPAGVPPHKDHRAITEFSLRWEMLQLAIQDNPAFIASAIEDQEGKRSYTYDTLCQLMRENPLVDYTFIIGEDSLRNIHTWYKVKELIGLVPFAVVDRVIDEASFLSFIKKYNDMGGDFHPVEMPLMEISSTDLRNRVGARRNIRYMVPESVRKYIEERGLYR